MEAISSFLFPIEIFLVLYVFCYNSAQLLLVIVAGGEVRRRLRGQAYEDLDIVCASPFTPPISLIVPAYNEEKTIIESLRSLMLLNFPRIEIIVVNDGSSDRTLETIIKEYGFRRVEITYEEAITTQPVRGFYELSTNLPEQVIRWVLVDKVNGGKADALNVGINASTCPVFLSMDADSLIDRSALLQAFRIMIENDRIAAIGGQVALANGCQVRNGQVVETGLPDSHLARFQMVEYLRSFSIGRTALAKLNSVLIISGVFGLFRKSLVVQIGGYLTKHVTHKIAREYVGESRDTVCEDMELIVRIQRFIKDKGLPDRVGYTPHPLCWTEAPEDLDSLGKQRGRWLRGLIETMVYHRAILFRPRYGHLGWFAYPYFLFFELLGAPIELFGYATLPVLFLLGMLDHEFLFGFLFVSIGYGVLVSVAAVVTSAWSERSGSRGGVRHALFEYQNFRHVAVLLLYAVLENCGYRQLTLWWRTRGIIDYFGGKSGWDKFERKGFEASSAAVPGHAPEKV